MTEETKKANEEAIAAFLGSTDNFQGFGFGSQAINAGFVGKVEKFEMTAVEGPGISVRRDPQQLNLKGGSKIIAEKGDASRAPSIVFEGGARQITLNTLVAHPQSFITLLDGTVHNFVKMPGTAWKALIGTTIECVTAEADENLKVPRIKRYSDSNETELRPVRKYEFKVVA